MDKVTWRGIVQRCRLSNRDHMLKGIEWTLKFDDANKMTSVDTNHAGKK